MRYRTKTFHVDAIQLHADFVIHPGTPKQIIGRPGDWLAIDDDGVNWAFPPALFEKMFLLDAEVNLSVTVNDPAPLTPYRGVIEDSPGSGLPTASPLGQTYGATVLDAQQSLLVQQKAHQETEQGVGVPEDGTWPSDFIDASVMPRHCTAEESSAAVADDPARRLWKLLEAWPFPWLRPANAVYDSDGPPRGVSFVDFRIAQADVAFRVGEPLAGEETEGIHTGRRRYRVECHGCSTDGLLLHPATTSSSMQILHHLAAKHGWNWVRG